MDSLVRDLHATLLAVSAETCATTVPRVNDLLLRLQAATKGAGPQVPCAVVDHCDDQWDGWLEEQRARLFQRSQLRLHRQQALARIQGRL